MLRSHPVFASRDLDETRERISGVMQPHRLLPLSARQDGVAGMEFVRLGGLGLGTIRFGGAMRVDVEAVENYHLLMFCLRGSAETRVGRHTLQAGTRRGIVCAPGSRFLADLSPDCEQFVVRLDRRTLEAHAGSSVCFDPVLDLQRPALAPWLDQLGALLQSPALLAAVHGQPLLAVEMERLLVHLLLAGQAWHGGDEARVEGRGSQHACVRRAEDFMRAHAEDPLRLADIARAAGVSARTLLAAFQRVRDCSPMQSLQQLRLDVARRRLADAPEGRTVAGIALECGFSHLGRFSQAYRERFGETPSATLRGG